MDLTDLQTWLLGEGIQNEFEELTRSTVLTELDNVAPSPDVRPTGSFDWPRLLLAGSVLARSDRRSCQEAALRIATGAVTFSDKQEFKDAGAVLLGKLSNFRAVALAAKRDLVKAELNHRLGVGLRIEAQRHQLEQSVLIASSGQWLQVNEFQQRLWEDAADRRWLSASAPTASGKTFLVLQWLIDQLKTAEARVAVYLAPTRALVSEIEGNLVAMLGTEDRVQVCSLPLREKYDVALAERTGLILVFTQERLHLFANAVGDALQVDLLIVDEAHKIADNQRGVILQDAIERVGAANPSLRVMFISPGTQNPEELLTDAPEGVKVGSVDSDAPTVLQNVIGAEQVAGKPRLWNLSIVRQDASRTLGVLQLRSSPGTLKKRLAFIAAAASERGGTLVYANGAADAEAVAHLISQLIPSDAVADPALLALADLARKGVHPQYRLASLVERGVAFHYGNMPSLIRLEVERLFRDGKIRFLVCTSTLIEGVNLSCRTIVLRGPRKGIGHPMEAHDFWNLAGRAGRWGDEFQGNIICIDPADAEAWPLGIPSRARYSIKREIDAVVERGEGLAAYLEHRAETAHGDAKAAEEFEHVGAYLLASQLRLGSIAKASLAKRHSPATVARLQEALAKIAGRIEVGAELASRHPGVSAIGLQNLLEAFRRYEGSVENLLPATVDSQDSFDRFKTILQRINQHLFPAFLPDSRIPLYALILVQWLKGFSLAAIIRRNVDYHDTHKRPYKLPVLIRSTMELVEQVARFKAPKYLSAYVDVLNVHLRAIGRSDLIDDGLDIGTQLEFGVSSKTLLSLMELGVSRMSAVALYEEIARDDLSRTECLAWVIERESQLEAMALPLLVVRELRDKLVSKASGNLGPSHRGR